MITVTICDDEEIYINSARNVCLKTGIGFDILTYRCAGDMIKNISDASLRGIFIIDIELPDINGLEAAKIIREKSENAIIIFLTNHSEYAIDGYMVNALRYVQKSNIDDRLSEAVLKAAEIIENLQDYIIITSVNSNDKIYLSSVIYIEKYKKNVEIYLSTGEVIKTRSTLNDIMNKINNNFFVEISRGLVVNAEHIKKQEGSKLIMDTGKTLYVSRNKIKDVIEKLINCWGKYEC